MFTYFLNQPDFLTDWIWENLEREREYGEQNVHNIFLLMYVFIPAALVIEMSESILDVMNCDLQWTMAHPQYTELNFLRLRIVLILPTSFLYVDLHVGISQDPGLNIQISWTKSNSKAPVSAFYDGTEKWLWSWNLFVNSLLNEKLSYHLVSLCSFPFLLFCKFLHIVDESEFWAHGQHLRKTIFLLFNFETKAMYLSQVRLCSHDRKSCRVPWMTRHRD